jgi:hypothetical protein
LVHSYILKHQKGELRELAEAVPVLVAFPAEQLVFAVVVADFLVWV